MHRHAPREEVPRAGGRLAHGRRFMKMATESIQRWVEQLQPRAESCGKRRLLPSDATLGCCAVEGNEVTSWTEDQKTHSVDYEPLSGL